VRGNSSTGDSIAAAVPIRNRSRLFVRFPAAGAID
jgi:hypothetical protein